MISKLSKEKLKDLEGSEILSLSYEGAVGVEKGKVIQGGKVIDKLDTDKKIKRLSDESFENEFGYYPGSKQHMKELDEEFGSKKFVPFKQPNWFGLKRRLK